MKSGFAPTGSCLLVGTPRWEDPIPPHQSHGLVASPHSFLQSSPLCEIISTFLVLCYLQTKTHNYSKLGQIWDIHSLWQLSSFGRFRYSPSINILRFSEPGNFPNPVHANGWSLIALPIWAYWVSANPKGRAGRKDNAFWLLPPLVWIFHRKEHELSDY